MLSEQDIFNMVWSHFVINKGAPSVMPEDPGVCAYRGKHGAKCAIGILLDDSEYSEDFESRDALDIFEALPSRITQMTKPWFMRELQRCHDNAAHEASNDTDFHQYIENDLVMFAKKYNLTIPPEK
jgi:hypothetical protein